MFIALFMLLLAFFIVLVSLANFEQRKARVAVQSVRTAFEDPNFLSSKEIEAVVPDAAAAEKPFDEAAKKVLEETLEVLNIERIQPANTLKVTIPIGEIFRSNSITEEGIYALKQIVFEMKKTKEYQDHEVEIYFGSSTNAENGNFGNYDELRQAGVLARTFVQLGTFKRHVAIGVSPETKHGTIDFFFYIRDEARPKLDFKRHYEAKKQAEKGEQDE